MKKVFIILIMMLSASFAACQIDENGVVTGAACKIPKMQSDTVQTQAVQKTEQSKIDQKKNSPKSKEKRRRMNFKFDRSLLYRNVTIIWFN